MTKTIKTDLAEVYMKEGVLYTHYTPIEATLEQTKELIAAIKEEFKAELPVLSLSFIKDVKSSKKEVRSYLASEEVTTLTIASAIITGGGLSKIVGNLFINFSKLSIPTKLFSDEGKALEWLAQYK